MPNGTATNNGKKPYVVKLPHNMQLEVDLASPHPTSLRILFGDGNGVKFEYSGVKDTKGTVDAIGTVVLTQTGKTKRWSPKPSPAAGVTAASGDEAFLETGEH